MSTHRATEADIPLIRQRLEEFYAPSPVPLGTVPDPPSPIGNWTWPMLHDPIHHIFVDPSSGALCRISANLVAQELVVAWLFPRANWDADNMAALLPVIAAALRDTAGKYNDGWTIYAEFSGLTLAKQRDVCIAWRDRVFGRIGGDKASLTKVTLPGGRQAWRIWWTIGGARGVVGAVP